MLDTGHLLHTKHPPSFQRHIALVSYITLEHTLVEYLHMQGQKTEKCARRARKQLLLLSVSVKSPKRCTSFLMLDKPKLAIVLQQFGPEMRFIRT